MKVKINKKKEIIKMKTFSKAKQNIEDWIGNEGSWLDDITDEQLEKINQFLEENNINMENADDTNKVAEFVHTLIFA